MKSIDALIAQIKRVGWRLRVFRAKKYRPLWAAILGLMAVFALFSLIPPNDGEMQPLDKLVLRMTSKYRRELSNNRFSLTYYSKPPRTVLIQVEYLPDADQFVIRNLIENAKELTRRVAREDFKLDNIDIEVTSRPVSEGSR